MVVRNHVKELYKIVCECGGVWILTTFLTVVCSNFFSESCYDGENIQISSGTWVHNDFIIDYSSLYKWKKDKIVVIRGFKYSSDTATLKVDK